MGLEWDLITMRLLNYCCWWPCPLSTIFVVCWWEVCANDESGEDGEDERDDESVVDFGLAGTRRSQWLKRVNQNDEAVFEGYRCRQGLSCLPLCR